MLLESSLCILRTIRSAACGTLREKRWFYKEEEKKAAPSMKFFRTKVFIIEMSESITLEK